MQRRTDLSASAHPLRAEGHLRVRAPPFVVRAAILDPNTLATIIPGVTHVTRLPEGDFPATISFGVGPIRSRQTVILRIEDESADALQLSGQATGFFGKGQAKGQITLHPEHEATRIHWHYNGTIESPVTLAGPRRLARAATSFTARVFINLQRQLASTP